jgi:hypothetical protein
METSETRWALHDEIAGLEKQVALLSRKLEQQRMGSALLVGVGASAEDARPTVPLVSIGVTYVMAYTYECDDGRI